MQTLRCKELASLHHTSKEKLNNLKNQQLFVDLSEKRNRRAKRLSKIREADGRILAGAEASSEKSIWKENLSRN